MSMDWMLQWKDIEWHTILQKQSLQYIAYKGLTLWQMTHRNWKWGDGKRYFMWNGKEGKAGVAIPTSDKTDFKMKAIKKDK